MLFNKLRRKEGYIAIISAVIITVIVIVIALVFSNSNYLGRFDTQATELKSAAREAAEGCLEYAKLKLAESSYSGNETINVGNDACTILPIEENGGETTVKVTSNIENRITNLKLILDTNTLDTISLEEVSSF